MSEFTDEYEAQVRRAVEDLAARHPGMWSCGPNASPEEQASIIREIAKGAPEGSVKRLEMELAARIVIASAPATGTQHRLLLVAQECIRQMEWARTFGGTIATPMGFVATESRPDYTLTIAPEGWKP